MDFVASRDFFNATELGLKAPADGKTKWEHPNHVPKGHRFSIGFLSDGVTPAKSLKTIAKESDKVLVRKLLMFNMAVVDDGSPDSKSTIAQIDLDVKAAQQAKENAPKPISQTEAFASAVATAVRTTLDAMGIKPKAA